MTKDTNTIDIFKMVSVDYDNWSDCGNIQKPNNWNDENLEAVKNYINNGGDVNARDHLNITVLMYACEGYKPKIIKLLLNNGADVNAIDKFGETPISYACRRSETKIVKLLLSNGANVTKNSLMYARSLPELVKFKLLKSHCAVA